MDLTAMALEAVARGAEASETRLDAWLNQAYRRILNAYDWPFTEATTTGAAGTGVVTITDFRKAILVSDSTLNSPGARLSKITWPELSEDIEAEKFAQTGTPEFWYFDGVANQIKTYPLGGTITVRYYKRINPLTAADSPVFDEEYHLDVVDRAMIEVYKDNDEMESAATQAQIVRDNLLQMARDYQVISREVSYIQLPNPYDG